jgi:alkylation response protein AidB-like acyl-CoA dehydrogenase
VQSRIVQALAEGVATGSPFAEAVVASAGADRLGSAFAAGYRAAIRSLFPRVGTRCAALCATEEGGGHPKAIRARLAAGRVSGRKTFVTFGAQAEVLLVVARDGEILRVAAVEASGPGVALEPMPALAFAPEVPHAQVVLDEAPADVLPGDGYDEYLKPFRTVEDIHVFGAALAYLWGAGRRARWPAPLLAELAAVVAALAALAAEDPRARATHLVLGGALALGRRLVAEIDLATLPDDERARWLRDRPLLDIAGKVRAQRFAAAAAALGL